MSRETKISKLLVGICINTGETFGDVARHLGISVSHDESYAYLSLMEMNGYIFRNDRLNKFTCPELTNKGVEQAKELMSSNIL